MAGSLVRIAGEPSGNALGSGFVCYQRSADCLLITSGNVIGPSAASAWINGQWQASPIWKSGKGSDGLVVLRCTDPALKNYVALRPLGERPPMGQIEIIGFHRHPDGHSPEKEPFVTNYEPEAFDGSTIMLQNDPYDFRIGAEHYGSPVVDSKRVVAVVTCVDAADPDAVIVAAFVDELKKWSERPIDLFEVLPEIFISYSHEDKAVVSQIDAALTNSGFRVWRDVKEIYPGDNWVEELEKILMRVRFVLIFCSKNSRESAYVKKEYETIVTRYGMPDPPFMIPVMLPGGELQPFLRSVQSIDLADGNIAKCIQEIIRAFSHHGDPAAGNGG